MNDSIPKVDLGTVAGLERTDPSKHLTEGTVNAESSALFESHLQQYEAVTTGTSSVASSENSLFTNASDVFEATPLPGFPNASLIKDAKG